MAPTTVVLQIANVVKAAVALWTCVALPGRCGRGKVGAPHMDLQLLLGEEVKVARSAAEHLGGYLDALWCFLSF